MALAGNRRASDGLRTTDDRFLLFVDDNLTQDRDCALALFEAVAENLHLLADFFAPLISLPFDDACAEQYGAIRALLAIGARPIGPNDC